MDSIEIKGKKYISSKRASKLTGYAKDYVGQLARQGKVDATRVGRLWYVSEKAILEHAGIISETNLAGESSNTQGHSGHTLRSLSVLQTQTKSPAFVTWSQVRYEEDDADLFPQVSVRAIKEDGDQKSNKNIVIPVKRIQERRMNSPKGAVTFDGVARNTKPTSQPVVIQGTRESDDLKLNWALIGSVGATLVLMLVFFTGLTFSSEWTASNSQLSTAYEADFSLIIGFFDLILQEGFRLLGAFFSVLIKSLGLFFAAGSEFIVSFFNF